MLDDVATVETTRVLNALKRRVKSADFPEGSEDTKRSVSRIYCTSFDSRIGRIYIASTDKGVCKVSVPRESRRDFVGWLREHFDLDSVVDNRSRNRDAIDQLSRYFNGKLVKFNCPIEPIGTPFQMRVWYELSKISYGTTVTYKHLAKRVVAPTAYQAVGRAIASNPLPIIIPCHRVIGSDGSLVGYSCGIKTKEFLLRLEGAIIL